MADVWLGVADPELSESLARRLVADGFRPCTREEGAALAILDASRAASSSPKRPSLALVAGEDTDDHVALLRAGYRGVFDAREDLAQLGAALDAIARGDTWADPEVAVRAGRTLHESALHEHELRFGRPLTLGRERRITRRLAVAEGGVRVFVSSSAGGRRKEPRIAGAGRAEMEPRTN